MKSTINEKFFKIVHVNIIIKIITKWFLLFIYICTPYDYNFYLLQLLFSINNLLFLYFALIKNVFKLLFLIFK